MLPFACGSNAFQPTLPARGATSARQTAMLQVCISTHAPRTGSDVLICLLTVEIELFQPTLSARGATGDYSRSIATDLYISTHAPRTGSDAAAYAHDGRGAFQPTLPARGATLLGGEDLRAVNISTHAPRTGSDRTPGKAENGHENFNPRSPHGERQRWRTYFTLPTGFQPTLPARGATLADAFDVRLR